MCMCTETIVIKINKSYKNNEILILAIALMNIKNMLSDRRHILHNSVYMKCTE